MPEKAAAGHCPASPPSPGVRPGKRRLRCGFSTGTAAAAAARAALRLLLTGHAPTVVSVRLPVGYYLPVPIRDAVLTPGSAVAGVIKDGGDDPDVTHKAEIRVRARLALLSETSGNTAGTLEGEASGIRIIGGEGVGTVTKSGLPVQIGEPAVNPVPREMLLQNLSEEFLACANSISHPLPLSEKTPNEKIPDSGHPSVFLPFSAEQGFPPNLVVEVEIQVPRGTELAARTLNPRLGIVGGISILGTTGLVRPFSHEAYEETIHVAMSVAAAAGCRELVLSTGGKSERFARNRLGDPRSETLVQIADFFAFALGEARNMGFQRIVLSAFFGKVVKMAQGHPYTHAHTTPLDLGPVAQIARETGCDEPFCEKIASANTAREALELVLARGAVQVVKAVAEQAVTQALRLGGGRFSVRLLLFDYDGSLLVDLERSC